MSNNDFDWNDATENTQLELVKVGKDGVYPIMKFMGNAPVRSSIGRKYGKLGHTFEVEVENTETGEPEPMGLYVSSIGLMQQLKENLPLAGKSFKISRAGYGVEMKYLVEEV